MTTKEQTTTYVAIASYLIDTYFLDDFMFPRRNSEKAEVLWEEFKKLEILAIPAYQISYAI